ncbi:hypothetical protein B0A55_11639, partial [Friedmanniomyces simplex]
MADSRQNTSEPYRTVLAQTPRNIPRRMTGASFDTASHTSAGSGSPSSSSNEGDDPLLRQYFAEARELSLVKGSLFDWETEKAEETSKRDLLRDQEREPE